MPLVPPIYCPVREYSRQICERIMPPADAARPPYLCLNSLILKASALFSREGIHFPTRPLEVLIS